MSFQRCFAIGAKDVDWLESLLVNILYEFLYWFCENLTVRACKGAKIRRESLYPLSSLCLLELAVDKVR